MEDDAEPRWVKDRRVKADARIRERLAEHEFPQELHDSIIAERRLRYGKGEPPPPLPPASCVRRMRQCIEDSLVDFHSHLNDAKEQNAMILDGMTCAADTQAERDRLAALASDKRDDARYNNWFGCTHGVDIMWDRYWRTCCDYLSKPYVKFEDVKTVFRWLAEPSLRQAVLAAKASGISFDFPIKEEKWLHPNGDIEYFEGGRLVRRERRERPGMRGRSIMYFKGGAGVERLVYILHDYTVKHMEGGILKYEESVLAR